MPKETRLEELLDEWEERQELGQAIAPEELCAECPELLPELIRHVRALEAMAQRFDTLPTRHTGSETPSMVLPRDGGVAEQVLTCKTELSDLSFHAKGGLGSVYVAKDRRLHREVALKFIHRRLAADPEARARFLIEAEVTGRLEHPGVIPVHGWGESNHGRLFYAMRFIRGDTLEAAIKRYHQGDGQTAGMALHQLLTHFVSLCKTVAYAHNCGIVHRDIKPENVMLGRYGETLLVDWGLAMPVGRDERARSSGEQTIMPSSGSQSGSASGTGAGTPAYMSPEQHSEAETIGPASDIYSLGVTLYKLLCGRNAFEARHHHELKQKVIRGEFCKPREIKASVPRALEGICLQAMAVRPEDRYATALDLADDVEHYLADEPVSAIRDTWTGKTLRWMRRHRGAAVMALSSLVLLAVLSLGAAVWFNRSAERESEARSLASQARDTSMVNSAYFAAQLIGKEIDTHWRILEFQANSHKLRELMAAVNQAPQDTALWDPVQAWLNQRYIDYEKSTGASAWFVNHARGVQVARSPLDDDARKTISQNWAFRNYFHTLRKDFAGQDEALAAFAAGEAAPIGGPNLSAAYFAKPQNKLKVAFTVPIWSAESDDLSREFLGVLGYSVDLGKFTVLKDAVLVDLNQDWLGGTAQRGMVLQHPALEEINTNNAVREAVVQHLDPALVERLLDLRQRAVANAHSGDRTQIDALFIKNFADPLASTIDLKRAACSPVVVRGRDDGLEDTGWVVIVPDRAQPTR